MWRLMKEALPVSLALRRRGLDIDELCPMCRALPESFLHIFKACEFTRLFWAGSLIPFSVMNIDCSSIAVWVEQVRGVIGKEEFEYFVTALWCIWYSRNKLLHEMELVDAQEAALFVQEYLQRFQEARNLFAAPSFSVMQQTWSPPPAGYVKLNFDASLKTQQQGVGIGVVARDEKGAVLAWKHQFIKFIQSVEVGEALAARCAVVLAYELDFQYVMFEGDSMAVVKQL